MGKYPPKFFCTGMRSLARAHHQVEDVLGSLSWKIDQLSHLGGIVSYHLAQDLQAVARQSSLRDNVAVDFRIGKPEPKDEWSRQVVGGVNSRS